MTECNCEHCEESQELRRILNYYSMGEQHRAFINNIKDRLNMCEEDRDIERYILRPNGRTRDRQARYFLRKLIEARQQIRVMTIADELLTKYDDAWKRLESEGNNDPQFIRSTDNTREDT